MRCVVQRVRRANVRVGEKIAGEIQQGLMVLVGISTSDTSDEVAWMARKLLSLRVFADAEGNMNLSVQDVGGGLLVVSQFTLYGELKKGTRPSFIKAGRPEHAEPLYNELLRTLKEDSELSVESGTFGAMMEVELVNDGPVTIILER